MTTLREWDQRFKQQAGWTASIRSYLYRMASIQQAEMILDIGCGTGVLLAELQQQYHCPAFGLDLDLKSLRFSRQNGQKSRLFAGDACRIPLSSNRVDIAFFHFVLLWLEDVQTALQEVKRCLKPGGWILCLAEPDHASRVDFPPPLDELGASQTRSLQRQGADISAGRKLATWVKQAGLQVVESGVLGSQWQPVIDPYEFEMEWEWLKRDGVECKSLTSDEIKKMDWQARLDGNRVMYVPMYYACARKSAS